MEKITFAATVALFSGSVFAGFQGPAAEAINTVQEAKKAADDSYVQLTGHIVEALGDETYLFQDNTGEIQVEIDHEDWRGQEVSPQDKVLLKGEVDVERQGSQIDVDTVQKM